MRLVLPSIVFCVACNSLFYQGDRKRWYPPEDFGIFCEYSPLQTADGLQLMTMHCPAKTPQSKGVVIQFHGNAQNMHAHYRILSWLLDEGYALLTFDYRGYGASEGESSRAGIYLDAQAMLDHARQKYGDQLRIFYGQSLGGAVLMRALLDSGPREDEIYIFEGTFLSYQAVARTALAARWFLWPLQFLAYVLVTDTYSSEEQAALFSGKKVLVIHGEKDPIVPIGHGEKIAEKMQQPLWRIAGGKHLDTWQMEHGRLRQELIQKLDSLTKKVRGNSGSGNP